MSRQKKTTANEASSRVLICGGRDWLDLETTYRQLDQYHAKHPIGTVIHGAARGADALADRWARSRGVNVQTFPADWRRHGKRAGFIRNDRMLAEGQPDLVIAFPGGAGTAHMKRTAQDAGLPVVQLP